MSHKKCDGKFSQHAISQTQSNFSCFFHFLNISDSFFLCPFQSKWHARQWQGEARAGAEAALFSLSLSLSLAAAAAAAVQNRFHFHKEEKKKKAAKRGKKK